MLRKNIFISLFMLILLASCSKDKMIIKSMQDYNAEMDDKGYKMGQQITLPKEVMENAKSISISFGDTETQSLKVDPKYFVLGENNVTFNITKKDGKELSQDATLSVFSSKPQKDITYEEINEYPHDTNNFVQGFQLVDGNMIYESDGQFDNSKILKYTLGSTSPVAQTTPQPEEGTTMYEKIFSEGSVVVGDKVYQLDWKNRIGFIYDKATLRQIAQFNYPADMAEGWGLTYDGKNLIASDGTSDLYFLDINDHSKIVRKIGVAGTDVIYRNLNELEYHDGFIYSNVWQQPIVIKIDPQTGEVVGKIDFTKFVKQNTTGSDDVLNGIAFKGENMLVTGKNWAKIYEVKLNQ